MDIEKKKIKFQKRFDKANAGDTVKVIEFKRKHFKKELSTNVGFGIQDLKEDAREFFTWMVTEKLDFKVGPTSMGSDFGVMVTVVKCGC
jgi:hypothetical protein